MARITIKRPDGSTESTINFDSAEDARLEVKALRAKIVAGGLNARGWTVALRVFR